MSSITQQATQMISQCRPNDSVDIPNPSNKITEGVTFSTVVNKLIKGTETFISKGVLPGDIALNINTGSYTTITAVDSQTSLSLAANIFSSGQYFVVFRSVPNGGYPWTPLIRLIAASGTPFNVRLITAGGDDVTFTNAAGNNYSSNLGVQVRRVLATGTDAGLIFAAFE